MLILKERTQRFSKFRGHTTSEGQNWDSNPGKRVAVYAWEWGGPGAGREVAAGKSA